MTPASLCLVVSTDHHLSDGLSQRLEAAGVAAQTVAPGYGLLEAVSRHRPHAVIIDGDTFGGLLGDVMHTLRLDPATEDLPIVLLQSLVTPADRDHARQLRLDGIYVRSPVVAGTAVQQVVRLIARSPVGPR